MAYALFNPAKPVTGTGDTRQASIDYMRQNLLAVRDACITGNFAGFDYSVSGGTAEQPAITYRKKGTEWIKCAITWGTTGGEAGNPTVLVYSYSSNSGGAYDTIGTCTITYDASGNVTATTWS